MMWRAMLGALALGLSLPASAGDFTDDRGITVTLRAPPQRIVSLLPSLTETVCALDACARLVGVDRYSNHPAAVRALPRLGGGLDPNVEAIVALQPDLVLVSTSSRASNRLEALGLKVVALDTKSHADVRRVLERVATLLGTGDPVRVWREIDAGVTAVAQSLSPRVRGLRVYFEVSRGPFAAGENSFIGETLVRLGVRNVVPAALGPFPRLNPEFVVRADPDLIMIGSRGMVSPVPYPGWDAMAAVRAGRVCHFDIEQADIVVRPGPRLAEAARIMARCLEDKTP